MAGCCAAHAEFAEEGVHEGVDFFDAEDEEHGVVGDAHDGAAEDDGDEGGEAVGPGEAVEGVAAEEVEGEGADDAGGDGGEGYAGVGGDDVFDVVVAEASFEDAVAEVDGEDVLEGVGGGEAVDHVLGGEAGGGVAHGDDDAGGDELDVEGGFGVFLGVEDAAHHEGDGEEWAAEGDDGDGLTDDGAGLLGAATEDHADGACEDDEGYGAEDGGDGGGAEAGGEGGSDGGGVVVLGGSGHAVEEDSCDGESDDAVGEGVEHGGVVEGLDAGDLDALVEEVLAGADNACCDFGEVHEGEVGDDAGGEGPACESGGVAESDATPSKLGAEAEAEAAEGDEEDEGLEGYAEGGGAGEDDGLGAGPAVEVVEGGGGGDVLGPEYEDEDDEGSDGDDVVEDGCPHVPAEGAAGVKDLTDDGVEAVEEDLGEAPEGEDEAEVLLFGGPFAAHDEDDGPGADDDYGGDGCDAADGEGDEAGDVVGAAVVVFGGFDDLGDEDRVEDAAGYEDVDEVGEGVGGFEDVADGGGGAEGDGDEEGFGEAEDPGYQGACGHDCTGEGAGTCHAFSCLFSQLGELVNDVFAGDLCDAPLVGEGEFSS